jgi:hypothetical protein
LRAVDECCMTVPLADRIIGEISLARLFVHRASTYTCAEMNST